MSRYLNVVAKRIIHFFIHLVVLSAFLVLISLFLIKGVMKASLETVLSASLGVDVAIDNANIDFQYAFIELTGVEFKNPHGFPNGPLARIPAMNIRFDVQAFKQREIVIPEIVMDIKEMHIVRNSKGKFNWFGLKAFKRTDDEAQAADSGMVFKGWPVKIRNFKLSLGQALYTDFSGTLPIKRLVRLQVHEADYPEPESLKDLAVIIAWEALIRVDQGVLKDKFDLVEAKIEETLGSRKDYLDKWHQGLNSSLVIKHSNEKAEISNLPQIKAL